LLIMQFPALTEAKCGSCTDHGSGDLGGHWLCFL
jgi:hypothetical protein